MSNGIHNFKRVTFRKLKMRNLMKMLLVVCKARKNAYFTVLVYAVFKSQS